MSELPFIPLYISDYLADTTHLTPEEHGAYMLLILVMWKSDGKLENDDAKLSRIVRLTPSKWRRIKPTIMSFFVIENGFISKNRMTKDIEKAKNLVNKRSEAGKRGGEAKSLKTKYVGVAIATDLLQQNSSKNVASQNLELIEGKKERISLVVSSATTTVEDDDFEVFWEAYPPRLGDRGKKAALKAYKSASKRASKPNILKGVQAYAVFCAAEEKINTPYVKLAASWLNQDGWLEAYESFDPKLSKKMAALQAIEEHNSKSTPNKGF
jgi:uncharacterized protein YdaU (DUF1376 family)